MSSSSTGATSASSATSIPNGQPTSTGSNATTSTTNSSSNNNSNKKIPYWKVYEIWEFNQIMKDLSSSSQQQQAQSASTSQSSSSSRRSGNPATFASSYSSGYTSANSPNSNTTSATTAANTAPQTSQSNLVQMTAIQDFLYILIQDEQNYLYQYDTKTEIFDEVNAGGIPPKERKRLTSVYYDEKIYVFGSDESSSSSFNASNNIPYPDKPNNGIPQSPPIQSTSLAQQQQQQFSSQLQQGIHYQQHQTQKHNNAQQQHFLCIFDLEQEEWTSVEISTPVGTLDENFCTFKESIVYFDQNQSKQSRSNSSSNNNNSSSNGTLPILLRKDLKQLTIDSLAIQSMNGIPFSRSFESTSMLSVCDDTLYIYNVDALQKIDKISSILNTNSANSNSNLISQRLDEGVILTDAKPDQIFLHGFHVQKSTMYSLVQIKNKIALLSIPTQDLIDATTNNNSQHVSSFSKRSVSPIRGIPIPAGTASTSDYENHLIDEQMFGTAAMTGSSAGDHSSIIKGNLLQNKHQLLNTGGNNNSGSNHPSGGLLRYFNDAAYSDLRFKFEGKPELHCNKQLLCYYSKYFRKHLTNPELLVVKISDFSFSTFQLLIRSFYAQFNNDSEMLAYDQETLLELFAMANKFSIPILQEKCESLIAVNESNFPLIIPLIRKANTFSLKEKCLDFMKKNKQLISGEYTKSMEKSDLNILLTWLNNKQCTHKNTVAVKADLKNTYDITTTTTPKHPPESQQASSSSQSRNPQQSQQPSKPQSQKSSENQVEEKSLPMEQNSQTFSKFKNFSGIISEGEVDLVICLYCKQILNYK